MIAVLIGIHLARVGLDPASIGVVISVGLAGAALAALLVTVAGDRLGRRRTLVWLAVLGAAGGAAIAASSNLIVVGIAAFIGMLNGMGRDRGASMVLDQAVLPSTTSAERRTYAFAIYNVVQDAGHALGSLLAGLPALLRRVTSAGEPESVRLAVGFYALLLLATAVLYRVLTPAVESRGREGDGAEGGPWNAKISRGTRRIVARISALFTLDGLGGGFLTTALLSLFFYARFHVNEAVVGVLFFGARAMNAVSHVGAAWISKRIGLVNTMVFTHIPSSLLLLTVPFVPSFPVAAILFLVREGLVEMDVPTRQSYVMAVVRPEERTFASGVTHLVRLGAWAIAPVFAGLFMRGSSLAAPILIGAGMKIAYDLLLYLAFRSMKPPEERGKGLLPATK
jgi:MFS family permease